MQERRAFDVVGYTIAPRWLRNLELLLAVLLVSYGTWLACTRTFWGIDHSDDEGSMLLSLVNYTQHGGLYTRTFTEYGPFQFYFHQIAHSALQIPFTHEGGRIVLLLCWLSSGLLAGLFIQSLTSSPLLAAMCFFATLTLSRVLRFEAGHPQEVVLLLIELSFWLALLVSRKAPKGALFAIGCVTASLCFTKINVSLFSGAALFFTVVALLSHNRLRSWLLLAGSTGAILLPAVLMRAHLQDWALSYCLVATVSIVLLMFTLAGVSSEDPLADSYLIYPAIGLVSGCILLSGIAMAQGTSPAMLWYGLVTLPLRHPAIFFIKLQLSTPALLLASVCSVAGFLLWNKRVVLTRKPLLLGSMKVVFGLITLYILFTHILVSALVTLPLIALLYLYPGNKAAPLEFLFPRVLLSSTLVFQFLQAYPVKGSQVNIAFTPGAAWALLLVFDGYTLLRAAYLQQPHPLVARFFKPQTAGALLILSSILLVAGARGTNFASLEPEHDLNLPGAAHIRVSAKDADIFPRLVAEIRNDCDVLFTMPGMYSLNIWSGVPTPNGLNVSPWMFALDGKQQQEILRILRTTKRPCVVYNRGNLRFWMPMGTAGLSGSPLAQYIFNETSQVWKIRDYELRIPVANQALPAAFPQASR